MSADICMHLAEFTGAHILLVDGRGKIIAQTSGVFRHRESVDGLYINSKASDRLLEIGVLSSRALSGEDVLNLTYDKSCRYVFVLPLYIGPERSATIMAYRKLSFISEEITLLEVVGAFICLILSLVSSAEVFRKHRDTEAVKLAIGNLSYSEFAAVLHIFREIGAEGLIVAAHVADKIGIARSVVVNALRKLEGAGIIETRSLGVKGTYIKSLSGALLEELYKIRD